VLDVRWWSEEARVTLHKNAKTCPAARKWVRRFREEGQAGLEDRSSAPRRIPHKTPPERVEAILALRELRFTAAEIAETLGMAQSTVSAILKGEGKGRLPRIVEEPDNRYERARPGELIHIDVKKLGRIGAKGPGHRVTGKRTAGNRSRGAGWEFVHVCVDDATRVAYVEVLTDERALTCVGFLRRAVAHFATYGIRVERLMTDNGNPYRSRPHALACRALGLKHIRTEPYRPRTNGKAERFIRTLLDGWAYRNTYRSSTERTAALPAFLDFYNRRRAHRAIGNKPPLARLTELNNVAGAYS
jgi:transposase InsO family protein